MVNLIVLSITVLISIIAFNRKDVFALSFNAYAVAHRRQWYRVLSYGFIHANWVHLLVNMFVLWMFGGLLEKTYVYLFATKGYFMYLLLYLRLL